MNKALRLIAAGALLAAGVPLSAMAQTITINATVNSQCNIGNATVNLGALDSAERTITNTGTNISADLQQGSHGLRRAEQWRQCVRHAEAA